MRVRCFSIIVLLLIACLSGKKAYAQEENIFDYWVSEFNLGYEFFEKEDFNNAIPHFKNAADVINQIDFSTSSETEYYPINNLNYLGVSYFRTEQFQEAAKQFEGTLVQLETLKTQDDAYYNQILENLINSYDNFDLNKTLSTRLTIVERLKLNPGLEDFNYAQTIFALAFNYRALGNNKEFYSQLIEVERILSKLGKTDGDYYAYTAYYLGNYYFEFDDYVKVSYFFNAADKLKDFLKEDESINLMEIAYLHGVSLYRSNEFNKAFDKLSSIIDDPYFKLEENISLYASVVDTLAMTLLSLKEFKEVKDLYNENLLYISNTIGENNEIFARQKANFGQFYVEREDYKNAESQLTAAKELYDTLDLKSEPSYFVLLNSIGLLNYFKGDYKEAESLYLESINLQELMVNSIPINIINTRNNLALVYLSIGEYEKAKEIYDDILKSTKNILGENTSGYATLLMNYGNFLNESGQYFKAEENYIKALEIFENTVGKNSVMYAKQLLNLGQFYNTTRQTKKSIEAYQNAIKIFDENNMSKSSSVGLALSGIGLGQSSLGDNETGLKTQLEAISILENTIGIDRVDYGKTATNVGLLYYLNKDYEKSILYYKKALACYEKALVQGHALYGNLLGNLSNLLIALNENEKALLNLDRTLEIYERNYGLNSYLYTTTLFQKGSLYLVEKKYDKAFEIFNSLEPKLKDVIDTDSDLYIGLLFNIGLVNELAGNSDKAVDYYKKNDLGIKQQLEEVFSYRNEREKKKFIEQFKFTTDWLSNLALEQPVLSQDLITMALNRQLILKGILLNSTKTIFTSLKELNSTAINDKIKAYNYLRDSYNKLLNSSTEQSKIRKAELKQQINTQETELVKLYNEKFGSNQSTFNKNWESVQKQLISGNIAIEFFSNKKRSDGRLTNEINYAAYLIKSDWEQPKVIELFQESDLKAILKNKNPNALYTTRGSEAKSTTNTKGLYELIWLPLEKYLEGIETIYYSPSGLLNQIPFAALDMEDKPILANQYNLVQLSSTYALTENNKEPKTDNSLFIGGINYEFTPSKPKLESNNTTSQFSALKSVSGTRSLDSKWNYLPGTLQEIKSIESLFSKQNKTYKSMSADEATETSFKNLSGNSPNVIHIATHGFFFENPKTESTEVLDVTEQNIYKIAEDPLLRSGLLFSGANYAWQNGNNPYTKDDGILTALEISNLDLSNTDIVILSACETGLGDIDGSEGVYGLQRAFKMAGVDIIVMSLWEVPDAETAEFMNLFYSNWLGGMKVRDAFNQTQRTMSTKYKATPQKWAAFVLFE
jgi:CHAT domain-containing protein/Tfp pilus assembly protein PilF